MFPHPAYITRLTTSSNTQSSSTDNERSSDNNKQSQPTTSPSVIVETSIRGAAHTAHLNHGMEISKGAASNSGPLPCHPTLNHASGPVKTLNTITRVKVYPRFNDDLQLTEIKIDSSNPKSGNIGPLTANNATSRLDGSWEDINIVENKLRHILTLNLKAHDNIKLIEMDIDSLSRSALAQFDDRITQYHRLVTEAFARFLESKPSSTKRLITRANMQAIYRHFSDFHCALNKVDIYGKRRDQDTIDYFLNIRSSHNSTFNRFELIAKRTELIAKSESIMIFDNSHHAKQGNTIQ